MIKQTLALALSLTAVTLPTVASAATTVDTVRTGVGTPGGIDANWTVNGGDAFIPTNKPGTWGPVVGTSNLVSGYGTAYIVPALNTNGTAVQNSNTTPTNYIYQTVFTMPGIANLSTALLTGRFWADNRIASIFLNNTQIYSNANTDPNQRQFLGTTGTTFGSATGFQYGNNLLTFNLVDGTGSNLNNWTGLNAAADITAAVPEPGTWMLMLLGFGAIGFAMRSRAKTRVRFQFA